MAKNLPITVGQLDWRNFRGTFKTGKSSHRFILTQNRRHYFATDFLAATSAWLKTSDKLISSATHILSKVSRDGLRCSCSTRLIIPCDRPAISANRVMETPRCSRSCRNNLTVLELTASRYLLIATAHKYQNRGLTMQITIVIVKYVYETHRP